MKPLIFTILMCSALISKSQDKPALQMKPSLQNVQLQGASTPTEMPAAGHPNFSPYYQNVYVDGAPLRLELVHYVKKTDGYAVRFSGMSEHGYFYREILFNDLEELLEFRDLMESGDYHTFTLSKEGVPFYFDMHPKVKMTK